jgi:hypothetical protein
MRAHWRTRWNLALVSLSVLGAGSPLQAQLILELPDLALQPNRGGQSFTLSLENRGPLVEVIGAQLDFMVGSPPFGSPGAPAIAGGGLTAPGLLFGPNNNGEGGVGNEYEEGFFFPQLFQVKTGTEAASGALTIGVGTFDLVTLEFDTTGVAPGVYSWTARDNPNGPSFFVLDNPDAELLIPILVDGTLTVIPEPHPWAVLAGSGLLSLALWRARSRQSAA